MSRKPQKTIFSGEPTNDPAALDAVLARATAVRVTPGGCAVYPVGEGQWTVELFSEDALAHVRDAAALRRLRDALAVSSFHDFICMCLGDLALEFLDHDRKRVAVVRVDLPGAIGWPLWQDRGVLADPGALLSWLREQGAEPPARGRGRDPS